MESRAGAESLHEPSMGTLGLIPGPSFALCEKADQMLKTLSQVLESLRSLALWKSEAVAGATFYLGGEEYKV